MSQPQRGCFCQILLLSCFWFDRFLGLIKAFNLLLPLLFRAFIVLSDLEERHLVACLFSQPEKMPCLVDHQCQPAVWRHATGQDYETSGGVWLQHLSCTEHRSGFKRVWCPLLCTWLKYLAEKFANVQITQCNYVFITIYVCFCTVSHTGIKAIMKWRVNVPYTLTVGLFNHKWMTHQSAQSFTKRATKE